MGGGDLVDVVSFKYIWDSGRGKNEGDDEEERGKGKSEESEREVVWEGTEKGK